jgi:hypothetical protein
VLAEHAVDWLADASQFSGSDVDFSDPSYPFEPALRDLTLAGRAAAARAGRQVAQAGQPRRRRALATEKAMYDAPSSPAWTARSASSRTGWPRTPLLSARWCGRGTSGEEFFDHGGQLHGGLWDSRQRAADRGGSEHARADGGAFVEGEAISLVDVTSLIGQYGRIRPAAACRTDCRRPSRRAGGPELRRGAAAEFGVRRGPRRRAPALAVAVGATPAAWANSSTYRPTRARCDLLADTTLAEKARKDVRDEADSLKAAFAGGSGSRCWPARRQPSRWS